MTETTADTPIAEILGRTAVFAELEPVQLDLLASYADCIEVPAGTAVFVPDDDARHILVIATGEVMIQRPQDEHRVRDVARFVDGESFGEIDVLRAASRNVRAVAVRDTRLVRCPVPPLAFADLAEHEATAMAPILRALVRYVARRIRATNDLLKENSAWVDELRRQVYTDKLTGLFNASYLADSLRTAPWDGAGGVILYFKPDRFKEINDTFGHDVGDAAIQLLAERFRSRVEPTGEAVRSRGNEIVGLFPEAPAATTEEIATGLLRDVAAVDLSALTGGATVRLSASIGIADASADGLGGAELLDLAYARMMEIRTAGGGASRGPDLTPGGGPS